MLLYIMKFNKLSFYFNYKFGRAKGWTPGENIGFNFLYSSFGVSLFVLFCG